MPNLNYSIFVNEFTIIAFLIGFLAGVLTCVVFGKKDLSGDKTVSLLLIFMWLGMHLIAFMFGKEISWTFDILGAGATGHLIGLDITLFLDKFRK